ncbi:Cytochrome c oxidase subunit 2 [Candidatus Accumulibacter aalborgensis]|uniref:Cytochrome c oxidase subunit 2 n=1 Tax=Candidatus Accumulibacter aalborgensis TaxID=1860102 RepID=A0A1A8XDF8_9PROT|nr:cytochrome c oxidase subunit II [Candidatus Accumulibacter aalborgensis]SBT03244.1 Cytochrome c oxidase subunit 2 [Candidatus Accumulibacter aalborgensis]
MAGCSYKNGYANRLRPGFTGLLTAGLLALLSGAANAAWELNLQEPVTAVARRVYHLHSLLLWVIVVIFIGVFAVVAYSIVVHRKSRGHRAASFHDNTTVELAWTIVPTLILIAIAFPATSALVDMRDTSRPDLTIKVTGYQWKWGYEYLTGDAAGVKYMSVLSTPREQIENKAPKGEHYLLEVDRPLVVPVGKKVRILTTANDVIHNWSVPAFAVKTDAVPGFLRDTWFRAEKEGTYRGQCSELCGKDHGFMPVVVEVVSEEKYAAWAAEQKQELAAAAEDPNKVWTLDELVARGEKVYTANCAACHQATGAGLPPVFPALDGSKIAKGPKQGHLGIVINGKTGTAMAAFGAQLSDTDIAAVVTYERNAWTNKLGDVIQPAEVKALRGK